MRLSEQPLHRHSGSGVTEPTWRNLSDLRGAALSAQMSAWVRDPGSLTRAVIGACAGQFRVRLRAQHWGRPLPSEQRLLGLPSGQRVLLREVELMCDEQPWVYARTLIPVSSLRGRARRLAGLRSKPLGAVLFADPGTRRQTLQVARLTRRHALYRAACCHLDAGPAALWGRRTLFLYAGKPLLVNEIFLPGIPARQRGLTGLVRSGC